MPISILRMCTCIWIPTVWNLKYSDPEICSSLPLRRDRNNKLSNCPEIKIAMSGDKHYNQPHSLFWIEPQDNVFKASFKFSKSMWLLATKMWLKYRLGHCGRNMSVLVDYTEDENVHCPFKVHFPDCLAATHKTTFKTQNMLKVKEGWATFSPLCWLLLVYMFLQERLDICWSGLCNEMINSLRWSVFNGRYDHYQQQ